MSAKLKYFFLSSLGLVALALVWMNLRIGSDQNLLTESDSGLAQPESTVQVAAQKVPPVEAKSPTPKPTLRSAPSSAPTQTNRTQNVVESEHTYTEPTEIIYLDQSPEQKDVLRVIDFVNSMKFPPTEEPEFIGVNDQGFDQYEYKTRDGAYVKQWRRSNEISVEEVSLDNGDKIIRRAPEQGFPDATVSYETKSDNSYKSVNYRPDGTVSSIYVESGGTGTTYYYDQQGRLTGKRTWSTKK